MNAEEKRPLLVQLMAPVKSDNAVADNIVHLAIALFFQPMLLMFGLAEAHALWPEVFPAAGYWSCFLLHVGVASLRAVKKRWWER